MNFVDGLGTSQHGDKGIDETENKYTKVYIGGLLENIGNDKLQHEFEKFGPVVKVWVARSPHSRGYAFVDFTDAGNAARAVREMNGKECFGSKILVQISRPGSKKKRHLVNSQSQAAKYTNVKYDYGLELSWKRTSLQDRSRRRSRSSELEQDRSRRRSRSSEQEQDRSRRRSRVSELEDIDRSVTINEEHNDCHLLKRRNVSTDREGFSDRDITWKRRGSRDRDLTRRKSRERYSPRIHSRRSHDRDYLRRRSRSTDRSTSSRKQYALYSTSHRSSHDKDITRSENKSSDSFHQLNKLVTNNDMLAGVKEAIIKETLPQMYSMFLREMLLIDPLKLQSMIQLLPVQCQTSNFLNNAQMDRNTTPNSKFATNYLHTPSFLADHTTNGAFRSNLLLPNSNLTTTNYSPTFGTAVYSGQNASHNSANSSISPFVSNNEFPSTPNTTRSNMQYTSNNYAPVPTMSQRNTSTWNYFPQIDSRKRPSESAPMVQYPNVTKTTTSSKIPSTNASTTPRLQTYSSPHQ